MRLKQSWLISRLCLRWFPQKQAARDGAPRLYDDVPGNVALDYHYGDAEAVKAAFVTRGACDAA